MIQSQTQSPEYWARYALSDEDADFLSNQLLESGRPQPVRTLAAAVVQHRVSAEMADLRRQLERGAFYQPRKHFTVGETLVFPALQFASGEVTAVREGFNPEDGKFDVIDVAFPSGMRSFAAGFDHAHVLNDDSLQLLDGEKLKPAEELAELYADTVAPRLDAGLENRDDYIKVAGDWFLKAMMADVNVGHLNLAEAVLDMRNGGPLPTGVLLRDLGLPADIASNLQEISLNEALARDNRFDEVSLNDKPAWFLRRLTPTETRELPAPIRPLGFDGPLTMNEGLTTLAHQIDDELEFDDSVIPPTESATVVLSFSHRLAGTLGWSRALAGVLPMMDKARLPLTFRDKLTGKDHLVWLVREGRYVWGLSEWYRQNELPAGAEIELQRGPADHIFLIGAGKHKPKREWVRVASVRDGHLRLETAQRAVTCKFDDMMSVFVDDPASMAGLRADGTRTLAQAVREAFPEISKLSPQGNTHARTLYAVVNVLVRAAPRDVFAALSASGLYQPVGDNYWHLSDKG
ncbi:MAG: hypothetical protein K1X39_06410 [Thermoflexales bacterium]|nr:hypothetical protein [Thermoflexales bacterium]